MTTPPRDAAALADEFEALAAKATGTLDVGAPDCLSIDNDGSSPSFDGGHFTVWRSTRDDPLLTVAVISPIDEREPALNLGAFIAWCFNHRTEIAAALRAPLPMSGDEWLEKAARYHDDAADTVAAEHPGIQGSKSQKRRRRHHIESATAIRALKTTPTHGEKTG